MEVAKLKSSPLMPSVQPSLCLLPQTAWRLYTFKRVAQTGGYGKPKTRRARPAYLVQSFAFIVPCVPAFLDWAPEAICQSESESFSVMSDSMQPHGLLSTKLLSPWNSPGKNTGMGCHSLLQGIFLTPGSNLGLSHFRQVLYHLSHQGRPRLAIFRAHKTLPHVFQGNLPGYFSWSTASTTPFLTFFLCTHLVPMAIQDFPSSAPRTMLCAFLLAALPHETGAPSGWGPRLIGFSLGGLSERQHRNGPQKRRFEGKRATSGIGQWSERDYTGSRPPQPGDSPGWGWGAIKPKISCLPDPTGSQPLDPKAFLGSGWWVSTDQPSCLPLCPHVKANRAP